MTNGTYNYCCPRRNANNAKSKNKICVNCDIKRSLFDFVGIVTWQIHTVIQMIVADHGP